VNSRTFKDLWNEIQGLSSTCPVFKYFQGLEFRRKNSSTFKYYQGCVGTLFLVLLFTTVKVTDCEMHNLTALLSLPAK